MKDITTLDEALAELDNMQNQRDLAMKVIHRLEKELDELNDVAKRFPHLLGNLKENATRLESRLIITEKN